MLNFTTHSRYRPPSHNLTVWLPFAIFFFAAAIFRKFRYSYLNSRCSASFRCIVLVVPFIPPSNGVGDTPPLPYYLLVNARFVLLFASSNLVDPFVSGHSYCLVGVGVMLFGVSYWAIWRVVLPKMFGYRLSHRKEALADGTVVAIVRVTELFCELKSADDYTV